MILEIERHPTPLGEVTIAWRGGRVCSMAFSDRWASAERALARRLGSIELVAARRPAALATRLDAYFTGELTAIDDVDVAPSGTDFQRAVWSALRCIPVGRTTTYGALARQIGAPSAVRAVGAANGANPIWLVIPCHRAIGADGSLTGYGGGLERKRWLLEHEGALEKNPPRRRGGTEPERPLQRALF